MINKLHEQNIEIMSKFWKLGEYLTNTYLTKIFNLLKLKRLRNMCIE
jgi:hypothetical protein